MTKDEIIDEAYARLSELYHFIDNCHYDSYSPEGLKAELRKISDLQAALETLR